MTEKEYVINIDFPEMSRVHLNPSFFPVDNRCRTDLKNPKHGGAVLATEKEASDYLNGNKILTWNSKPVTNLTRCKICARSPAYLI